VTVPFDLATLLAEHQGESFELRSRFMNPQSGTSSDAGPTTRSMI